MNVEEYISSGVLEAYVQGALSEKERLDVEHNLSIYPELRKELALIEEVQEKLLQKAGKQPKPSTKANLFARIDASVAPEAKVVSLEPEKSNAGFWKLAVAASVTIALISSYLAYDYWNKWKKTEGSLATLIAQNQQIAQDYNNVNNRLDQIRKDIDIINNPSFERVVMKGTPNAPQSLASVYWNKSTRELYLSIQDMKELTAENQYQLWAIIDGKPVDAGVFDGDVKGLLKMKDIAAGATTFAVTIEARGGKPAPSLETMQVAGEVPKV